MTFLERITRANEVRIAHENQIARERQGEIETRIKEALTKLGVTTNYTIKGCEVQFDGITLQAVLYDVNVNWQVQGTCPDCGETCWSRAAEGLDNIGEMYHEFDPHYDHRCHIETATTVEENLIDAIRQFIKIEVQSQ